MTINEVFDNFDVKEILDEIDLLDAIDYYGDSSLLSQIGADVAAEFFGDDILAYFDKDSIVDYLITNDVDLSKYSENDIQEVSDAALLVELCKRNYGKCVLTKDRMEEIVNMVIDELPNKVFR